MSCVFTIEQEQICGAPVEISTIVSAPYGDASMTFYLVLPDHKRITLHFKHARSAVELGGNNLYRISEEDKAILISSAQHNLNLQGERGHVYQTIKDLYNMFACEPDSVPF